PVAVPAIGGFASAFGRTVPAGLRSLLVPGSGAFAGAPDGPMVTRVQTVAFQGIEAVPVDVQVQIGHGIPPVLVIVGLPDKAVRESGERVRAALIASGLSLPSRRI